MASLGDLFVRVGADIGDFQASMKSVTGQLDRVGKDFDNISSRLAGAGTTLTAAVTAPLVGLGAAAIVTAGQMEMTQTAFTTLFGNAETAQKMIQDLTNFAAATPFEIPQVLDAAKKLKAMGFETEQIIPTLRTLGDAASGVGLGADGVNRLTLALGQMAAKGKVSAAEMNQLTETGIPAWDMLAKKIGVDIPTAMKLAEDGAINAAAAVPAILAGMQEKFGGMMEQQSKTLLGQWSNFKDEIGKTLVQIGTVLLPIAKQMLEGLKPVLETVKSMATAFAQLPEPVQRVALGIAALTAAVGPILLALAGLSSAMSSLVALPGVLTAGLDALKVAFTGLGSTLTGVAVPSLAAIGTAVAVAAAAFAAWEIGKWLYENFEPFKTMVDAVAEAVKSGLVFAIELAKAEFYAVKEALGLLVTSVQSAIDWFTSFKIVQVIIQGIKEEFGALFGAVKKVFDFFGDSFKDQTKLLQDYNTKHKETSKTVEGTTKAIEKTATSAKTASTEATNHGASLLKLGSNSKEAEKAQRDLEKQQEALEKATQKAKDAAHEQNLGWKVTVATANETVGKYKELESSVINLKAQHTLGKDAAWAMGEALKTLGSIQLSTKSSLDAISSVSIPEFMSAAAQITVSIDKVKDAFGTLNIESTAALAEKKQKAIDAYNTIANSGTASAKDIDNAFKAMVLAVDGYNIDGVEKTKGAFSNMATQVSTVITNFAQDIGKSLFDGDMSWGEKTMSMLKGLGSAVISSFIEPATKALNDFISGTISDLLGGKGFGGMLSSLKDIGSEMGKVFGIGGGAASGATTAAGAAGSAGSTAARSAGSAGSAVGSGIAGIVGAVGSVVSAISGVIGNFQMAGMNKTLDLIEKSTRYTEGQTLSILEKLNEYLPGMKAIEERLTEMRNSGVPVWSASDSHINIQAMDYLLSYTKGSMDALEAMKTTPRTINVTVNGATDAEEVAQAVMDRIALEWSAA